MIYYSVSKSLKRGKPKTIASLSKNYVPQLLSRNASVSHYIRVYRLIKGKEIKSSGHLDGNSGISNKNPESVHFYIFFCSFWVLRISIQVEGKQTYKKIIEGTVVRVLSKLPCVRDILIHEMGIIIPTSKGSMVQSLKLRLNVRSCLDI